MTTTTYFVLEADPNSDTHATLDTEGDAELDLGWLQGQSIPSSAPRIFSILVEDEPTNSSYPDFLDVGHGPAVSARFKDAIAFLAADNLHFHPVRLISTAGQSTAVPYFMMNVIGRIDGIDREKSQMTLFKNRIFRMHSLALDLKRVREQDIFRLHGYSGVIIVSERIAQPLRESGLTGFILRDANGWGDAHRF